MVRISNLRANNITPHQARLTLAYNNTSSTNTQPTHTHRGQKEKIKERLHGQIEIQKKKKIQIKSSRSLVFSPVFHPRDTLTLFDWWLPSVLIELPFSPICVSPSPHAMQIVERQWAVNISIVIRQSFFPFLFYSSIIFVIELAIDSRLNWTAHEGDRSRKKTPKLNFYFIYFRSFVIL